AWRTRTRKVLDFIHALGVKFTLASIENSNNYKSYKTDVYPPDYRIQINFDNEENKSHFSHTLKDLQKDITIPEKIKEQIKNIRLQDESRYQMEEYSMYITPHNASKYHAANHVMEELCRSLSIDESNFFIFFA